MSSNKSINNRQRLFDKRNRRETSRTLHFHFHHFIPWLHTLSRFLTNNIYNFSVIFLLRPPLDHPFIIPSYRPLISRLLYPSNLLILRVSPSPSSFSRSSFSRLSFSRSSFSRSSFSRSSFSRSSFSRSSFYRSSFF